MKTALAGLGLLQPIPGEPPVSYSRCEPSLTYSVLRQFGRTTTQETYFLRPGNVSRISCGWRWWITVVQLADGITVETYTSPQDCLETMQKAITEA